MRKGGKITRAISEITESLNKETEPKTPPRRVERIQIEEKEGERRNVPNQKLELDRKGTKNAGPLSHRELRTSVSKTRKKKRKREKEEIQNTNRRDQEFLSPFTHNIYYHDRTWRGT